jgi:hypothetical protein
VKLPPLSVLIHTQSGPVAFGQSAVTRTVVPLAATPFGGGMFSARLVHVRPPSAVVAIAPRVRSLVLDPTTITCCASRAARADGRMCTGGVRLLAGAGIGGLPQPARITASTNGQIGRIT